jgi:hypothetical protein
MFIFGYELPPGIAYTDIPGMDDDDRPLTQREIRLDNPSDYGLCTACAHEGIEEPALDGGVCFECAPCE